ncbi:unnamed protein product [Lampetra fluviatilis]
MPAVLVEQQASGLTMAGDPEHGVEELCSPMPADIISCGSVEIPGGSDVAPGCSTSGGSDVSPGGDDVNTLRGNPVFFGGLGPQSLAWSSPRHPRSSQRELIEDGGSGVQEIGQPSVGRLDRPSRRWWSP